MRLIIQCFAAVVARIAVTYAGDADFPSLRTPQLDKRFNYNKIVWCKQSREFPPYDLSSGANCGKYNTATLIANPASYDEFRKVFCRLKPFSQFIKFKHVQRIRYGSKKFPNLAYHTLKWSLVNLRPDPEQLWLEFGVANGFSVNLTAYVKERVLRSSSPVYGFDWFRGLPEDWHLSRRQYYSKGMFSRRGEIPPTRPGVHIVSGLFNQTLAPFLQRHVSAASKISFVNMDMDLYSGARYVLESIISHLSHGAVIHFHDFFNAMNSCNSDEMRALYDVLFAQSRFGWTKETSLQLQYMPFETVGFREPITFRVV